MYSLSYLTILSSVLSISFLSWLVIGAQSEENGDGVKRSPAPKVSNTEFLEYFSKSSSSLSPPLSLSLMVDPNSAASGKFKYYKDLKYTPHDGGQGIPLNNYSSYVRRPKREISNESPKNLVNLHFGDDPKSSPDNPELGKPSRFDQLGHGQFGNITLSNEDKALYALLTGTSNYHYDPKTTKYYYSNKRSSGNKKDIYIAGFFPTSQNISEGGIGRGVLPAVQLALHHINQNDDILKNYVLHISWNNTKCDAAEGMKAFFDSVHEPPRKLMLFGDACTQVTDPIAKASKHWKIVQLSYADMHPMYSAQNYPNLFRIVPSENEFNAPRVELMRVFNWTRVGTLYQNQPRYSLAHNRLVSELEAIGVEVVATLSFSDDINYSMQLLKEKDVRIILGNFNETWARRIFCEAYNYNMFGRRYEWIIVGTYNQQWWRQRDVVGGLCELSKIETALKGALIMDLLPLSSSQDIKAISGKTPDEYRYFYDIVRLGEYSRFHGYAYDGVFAIALALDNLHKFYNLNSTTKMNPADILMKYRYHDEKWERAFLQALEATNFIGVTGPVRFRDNGRKGTVLIKQFQTFHWTEQSGVNAEVKVGEFDGVTQTLYLSKGQPIVWNGKYPPKDRTFQIIEHTRVNVPLFAILAIVSTIGIILASFFLAINIKFRNQRYIKMSSPYLNNLIIIGCILAYLSIIILGLDSSLTSIDAFPYICTARAWVLMSGFTLAFGSMFSKTWRVHSIFTNVKLNKKVIKDMQLFIVVGIILAIDFAILTTWQFLDPFYRETKQMEGYVDPSNDDIEIIPEIEYCKSDYMTIFIGCIYAYKGLLMIFGCFLAWETRHVSIPALNDSKYIGMSVYNSVMMCVIGAPLSHVLSDKQDANFAIISLFIIFCTTSSLCLVFLPKVIELKRNPKGTIEKRVRATIKPQFGMAGSAGGTGSGQGPGGGSVTGTGTGPGGGQGYMYTGPSGGGGGGGGGGHPSGGAGTFAGRRSSGSLYETELKQAKQTNQTYRRKIREIDKEIQAIAKLLSKDDDKEVQALLRDVMSMMTSKSGNLLIPQDKLLKKEDTDISSLYSLNSEGGDEVIIVDNNNDNLKDKLGEESTEKKIEDIIVGDHLAETKDVAQVSQGPRGSISIIHKEGGDNGAMRKHMENNFYVNNANIAGENKLTAKSPISVGSGGLIKASINNHTNLINKNLMEREASLEKSRQCSIDSGSSGPHIPTTQTTSFFYYYYPPPPTISNAEVVEDEDSQPYVAIEEKFISPPSFSSSSGRKSSSDRSVVRELANSTASAALSAVSVPVGNIQPISVRPTTLGPIIGSGIGVGMGSASVYRDQNVDRRFSLAIETTGHGKKSLTTRSATDASDSESSASGMGDKTRRMSYDPSLIGKSHQPQVLQAPPPPQQQHMRRISEPTHQEANVLEREEEEEEEIQTGASEEELEIEEPELELEESDDGLDRRSSKSPTPPPPPPPRRLAPLSVAPSSMTSTEVTLTAAARQLDTISTSIGNNNVYSHPVMYASCSALNEYRGGARGGGVRGGMGRQGGLMHGQATSGEIPLDVSLLPIFHRLWSDRRSTSTNIVDICDQEDEDEEDRRRGALDDEDDPEELGGEIGRQERLRKKGRLMRLDGYPGADGRDRQMMLIRRTASVVPGTGYKTASMRRGGHSDSRAKRFMVSCPNLLEIKCDIVEYL